MSKKEFNLYDFRRELLTKKRELRKQIIGQENAGQRTMQLATKVRRAIKVELGLSKSKASGTNSKETSIEIFIEDLLKENNIKYVKQKRIQYLNYDFYLPDINLLIEVQGEYHHFDANSGKKINKIQEKNLKKDELKRQFAKNANIELLEIYQREIKENPEEIKQKLLLKCGL